MIKRNSNCDKCNIKLKGNGAYSLQYLGKTYWLCGHCMNGIVKREILTSEPIEEKSLVIPKCDMCGLEIKDGTDRLQIGSFLYEENKSVCFNCIKKTVGKELWLKECDKE